MEPAESVTSSICRSISVAEAAERIGVSAATVRNWIKVGELERGERGEGVSLRSVELCERREMVGSGRLVSRANKRYKSHRADQKRADASRYDESLSESRRNIDGIYYTPQIVARDMLRSVIAEGEDLSDRLFIDPCCGSGNILVEALSLGFRVENIYGYEIDPQAAKIARQRIFEATGCRSRNIVCGDFLCVAATLRRRFDYCVTNPPWGKKMDRRVRREVTKRYALRERVDSSSLFLVASMGVLRDGGRLNFLMPESFFVIRSYSDIRAYVLEYDVNNLVDYGRAFPSLLTSAAAISITKREKIESSQILCRAGGKSYMRDRKSFLCNPMLTLNMWSTPAEAEIIERLFEREHITLQGEARWGLGVVTGNNDEYTSTQKMEGYREVIRGADILPESMECFGVGRIQRGEIYLKDELDRYQQVASLDIYEAPEKLIYKFVSDRLCFAVDREALLTLNSANILVLNKEFPLAAEELARLLNSDFMTWLFQAIFHTRKVLRGDLESLPIYPDYFRSHEEFCEKSYLEWLNVEKFR